MKKEFNFSVYLMYTKTIFLSKLVYKFDYVLGLLNTCIQLFIACLIWQTLYGGNASVEGISLPMVITTIVIGQGLSNAYFINDQAVSKLIKDGSISFTLLKPVSFRLQLLAEALGEITFRILSNFLPAVIIFSLATDVLPPAGVLPFLLFLISISLGFGVLWMLSSIVQFLSFWVMNVWSLSTIKNVLITVLSGAVIPIWFLPEKIASFVSYTPFGAIYFIPTRLYLGDIPPAEAGIYFTQQLLWIIAMLGISHLLWSMGKQRIVVQGG
ncbi:ABC transporter permease [Reinekea marinisedimentorum]|uniref:ABC-2 type transport system permease protein n=1 Tax=Reinekea marinisedimentorum TaxID=230495 RepID=A0A4R3I168_9GAMM|nr:ABC-2 family transporter protein [Reinekea marinisedimentorum]TCS37589.1 ABC-2 type transport system permease protein [Reinekea marinisedimentorum]